MVFSVFLLAGVRLPLLKNWARPLMGPHSVLTNPREASYFLDILALNNVASYRQAADLTAGSGCGMVGLDVGGDRAEYPFQALVRERNPAVRFVHTGVENRSARYEPSVPPRPCAVLCFECADEGRKIARYESIGPPAVLGRFVLFLAR